MYKTYFLILFIIFYSFISYSQSYDESYDQFEVYKQDKNNKILIIPFENKMYASSMDDAIAANNQINYYDVKEELKKGIAEQILLSIGNKIPAVSMIHHRDTSADLLNYVYNSIGFKYDIVKSKDTIEEPKKKSELIKNKMNEFISQISTEKTHEKEEYERGRINNGEIHTKEHNAERFMNVVINNPNLLTDLNRTYLTNYYIFINEFHISKAYSSPNDYYNKFRKISIHYTAFNQKGKEVDAGISSIEMPANVNDLRKIEKTYLYAIANEISAFVPDPVLDKATIKKEADDKKKANNQRSIIHGLLID
tara:strand:+ start:998 stop:1924 length:927 start_codon:yes stop_codon:yes gene_type:complete